MKTITMTFNIDDLNKQIRSAFTEDSDVSDLMLKTEEDVSEFILNAIHNTIFPPQNTNERFAFAMGLKYGKQG